MDDIAVRSRYPRHSAPGRRRRRVSREKLRLPQLIARQAAVAIAVLLIIGVVKSVNTPVTNFVTQNVRYVLVQNIELSTVFKFLNNTFTTIKNVIAPDSAAQAKNGTDTTDGSGTANTASLSNTGNASVTDNASVNGNASETTTAITANGGKTSDTGDPADSSGLAGAGSTPVSNAVSDSDSPGSPVTSALPATSVLSASMEAVSDKAGAGEMTAPVKGTLSSPFGERADPATGTLKMHNGIDIDVGRGGGIAAAFDGTVTEAGSSPAYGNYIRLRHAGGLDTVYAHCSKLDAAQGDMVKQGSIIAEVSDYGAAVGIHLHFEVWKDGKPVDPLNYIDIALQ